MCMSWKSEDSEEIMSRKREGSEKKCLLEEW